MPADIKINLHPVNFIILSGLLQCIIIGVILLLSKNGRRLSNCRIGIVLILCTLHFAWSLLIDTNLGDLFKQLFWFPYSYLLALGPLVYFYTKSLTAHDFNFRLSALRHFLPAGVELIAQVYHPARYCRQYGSLCCTWIYNLPRWSISCRCILNYYVW